MAPYLSYDLTDSNGIILLQLVNAVDTVVGV